MDCRRWTGNSASTTSESTGTGAIFNLKLIYSVRVGLMTVTILSSAIFCAGQGDPQPQTSDSAQSAQSPATDSSSPGKTVDQPSAQSSSQDQKKLAQEDPNQKEDPKKKKDDRMFYVMPHYLTVDGESQVKPISWKEKFAISAKGSFDPYEFTVVGIVAGIRQAENSSPAFGQGAEGHAKRYGAAFADQVDGNVMVGGVFPSIMKIDPRYFQLGKGSVPHRMGYAFSRIFVARTDAGKHVFNIPEFAGNATAIAISNFYYPAADRGFGTSFSAWGTQMGLAAFGNELKALWPDIHHYLQKKHERHLEKQHEKEQQEQNQNKDQKTPNQFLPPPDSRLTGLSPKGASKGRFKQSKFIWEKLPDHLFESDPIILPGSYVSGNVGRGAGSSPASGERARAITRSSSSSATGVCFAGYAGAAAGGQTDGRKILIARCANAKR